MRDAGEKAALGEGVPLCAQVEPPVLQSSNILLLPKSSGSQQEGTLDAGLSIEAILLGAEPGGIERARAMSTD